MADSSNYLATPTKRNPWNDGVETFGTIGNVLTWAYRTGHLKRPSSHGEEEESRRAEIEKYPSIKLIKLLRSMTELQKKLYAVNVEIQCRMQDKETGDITHISAMEKRVKQITDMSDHLQTVVKDKDSLINRLQQPFIGDFMKIEATYHKYVKDLLVELSPVLSDLASHLDNITWAAKTDIKNDQMDSYLGDIASALAGLQTSVMSMAKMRTTMSKLHNSTQL